MYLADGDRYVVFASKGGHDIHPHWMLNIEANPDVELEIGDRALQGQGARYCAKVPSGTGCTRSRSTAIRSSGSTREKAARTIPVVVIEPLG